MPGLRARRTATTSSSTTTSSSSVHSRSSTRGARHGGHADRLVVHFEERRQFRAWLSDNHESCAELWFQQYKKSSGRRTLSYEAACEEAVCYGWVDGIVQGHDEHSYLRRFTPRRARSNWCRSNRKRVKRMFAQDRMHPVGVQCYEEARANGCWEQSKRNECPPVSAELLQRLQADPDAHAFFRSLAPSYRNGYLRWIHSAQREQTRTRRLDHTMERLRRKEKLRM
jgi:uncharacterized protein YdeI (YjbR/CyaY-like superfamily)